MLFSIDRIVSKTAVLLDERGQPLEVPVAMLPPGARPGEMVDYQNNTFSYASQKTAMRRETMAAVLGQLLARGDEVKAAPEAEDTENGPET